MADAGTALARCVRAFLRLRGVSITSCSHYFGNEEFAEQCRRSCLLWLGREKLFRYILMMVPMGPTAAGIAGPSACILTIQRPYVSPFIQSRD